MKDGISGRHAYWVAAIDVNGADFSRWSDSELANQARQAVLVDRSLRAHLERTARFERGLSAARQSLDAEIRASGAVGKVSAAVLARRVPRARRARWMVAAAAIVLAAGIGGIVDGGMVAASPPTVDVVVLDPLVFGPLETDTE